MTAGAVHGRGDCQRGHDRGRDPYQHHVSTLARLQRSKSVRTWPAAAAACSGLPQRLGAPAQGCRARGSLASGLASILTFVCPMVHVSRCCAAPRAQVRGQLPGVAAQEELAERALPVHQEHHGQAHPHLLSGAALVPRGGRGRAGTRRACWPHARPSSLAVGCRGP